MSEVRLPELMRQMAWADARVWQTALASPEGRDDEALRTALHHIHLVQDVFLRVWRDEPFEVTPLTDFTDAEALRDWARRYHGQAADVVAGFSADELGRVLEFPWDDQWQERFGGVQPVTLGESVLQVCFHTAHHRGQACTRLRELGQTPPLIDFIIWVILGRPAAEWPTDTS